MFKTTNDDEGLGVSIMIKMVYALAHCMCMASFVNVYESWLFLPWKGCVGYDVGLSN